MSEEDVVYKEDRMMSLIKGYLLKLRFLNPVILEIIQNSPTPNSSHLQKGFGYSQFIDLLF